MNRFLAILSIYFLAGHLQAQVTFTRLLNSAKEPQNWLTYSGDYAGLRFSRLDQINTGNVQSLVAKWVFQSAAAGKFETTPLAVDGVLYGTAPDNRAFALDARTGRPIWLYQRQLPSDIRPCCGRVNRGLAIPGGKVFMGTLDAHVIALDTETGNVIWDVSAVDYTQGYSFTLAPLAVKNLIMVGASGGEYGIRGFIDAYDAESGQRKWRFYTVPGPGEPGNDTWEGDSWKIGGAPAWITGVYDPVSNQLFWPTGNPSPSNRGAGRAGSNLYSNSLLALNADTGKLNWYFQFTKHNEHDWDATQVPIMIDSGGKHLIAQANRNGFFYVLDRTTGEFLNATKLVDKAERRCKKPIRARARRLSGRPDGRSQSGGGPGPGVISDGAAGVRERAPLRRSYPRARSGRATKPNPTGEPSAQSILRTGK